MTKESKAGIKKSKTGTEKSRAGAKPGAGKPVFVRKRPASAGPWREDLGRRGSVEDRLG